MAELVDSPSRPRRLRFHLALTLADDRFVQRRRPALGAPQAGEQDLGERCDAGRFQHARVVA